MKKLDARFFFVGGQVHPECPCGSGLSPYTCPCGIQAQRKLLELSKKKGKKVNK